MVDVSVVVVNWNAVEEVLACAASVLGQKGLALELVVVDNGSVDDSVARLAAAYPAARIISASKNLGYAEGCNLGIAATTAPWVLLLNNDVVVEPGTIACLLQEGRRASPTVAALQPALVFMGDPDRLNSTGLTLFANGTARDRSFGRPVASCLDPTEVFGTTAGAALYRRSALEQVALPSGVLDRGFFMYMEDVDLAWRLRLAGYSACYVAQARVRHHFQRSSRRREAGFVARHCRENRVLTLVKNASLGLLVRGLGRTASDLLRTLWHEGPAGLARLISASQGALTERALVRRLSRVDRKAVERQWVR